MKIYRLVVPLLGLFAFLFASAPVQAQNTQAPQTEAWGQMYDEEVETIQAVLFEGYSNFLEHREKGSLNSTELQIQSLLDEKFPALETKVQKQNQLIETEYTRLLEQTIQNAGQFSMEKMQQAQQKVLEQLQTKYSALQEKNIKEIENLLKQLVSSLINNQNTRPGFTPKNEEAALSIAVVVYYSYTLEQMSPEDQEAFKNALQQIVGAF